MIANEWTAPTRRSTNVSVYYNVVYCTMCIWVMHVYNRAFCLYNVREKQRFKNALEKQCWCWGRRLFNFWNCSKTASPSLSVASADRCDCAALWEEEDSIIYFILFLFVIYRNFILNLRFKHTHIIHILTFKLLIFSIITDQVYC